MKIKPRFYQYDCVEGDKADLRQAGAVSRWKPDIVIFELPQSRSGKPGTIFNRYSCAHKPIQKVEEIIKGKKRAAKKYPYALSDVSVWENIQKLWREGINTQVYNVDSPRQMRSEFNLFPHYPACRKDWLFWAYLYLRDTYMARNIRWVLEHYSGRKDPTILIFLQSIHWDHAQFLLGNPSPRKVWDFYLGKFSQIKPKTIEKEIGKRSKILAKYWRKNQQFSSLR